MKLTIEIDLDFELVDHLLAWLVACCAPCPPSAPTNLTATVGANMNVTLTWTPPVLKPGQSAIKSYRVYAQAQGAPDFGLINEVTDPTLIDENVAAGTWLYKVTTVDVKDRESAATDPITVEVTVAPDSVPPSPPTNLAATVA